MSQILLLLPKAFHISYEHSQLEKIVIRSQRGKVFHEEVRCMREEFHGHRKANTGK